MFVGGEEVLAFVDELAGAFVNHGDDRVFEKLLRGRGGVCFVGEERHGKWTARRRISDAVEVTDFGRRGGLAGLY